MQTVTDFAAFLALYERLRNADYLKSAEAAEAVREAYAAFAARAQNPVFLAIASRLAQSPLKAPDVRPAAPKPAARPAAKPAAKAAAKAKAGR